MSAHDDGDGDLSSADAIRGYVQRIDREVGSGAIRTTEMHNTDGMGSTVIAHEVESKLVKIIRRTELAPPTISTAYYFSGDRVVCVETRITDTFDAPPPRPDQRFYVNGELVRREGKPPDDTEPDTKRAAEDLVIGQLLLTGVRERSPDIRLPAGVW